MTNLKYIVYETVNIVNNKIYIGVHKTKDPYKFDGYIGCGIYVNQPYTYKYSKTKFQFAVNKYGVDKFKRTTLAIFDTEEEAYNLESLLVNKKFLERNDVYNMILGGINGMYESLKTKVYQYDLNGKFVKEYNSFYEASVYLNCDESLISFAVRKKNKAKSYFWSTDKLDYIDLSLYNKGDNNKIVIHLYDIKGNYIKSYDSQTLLCKDLSVCAEQVRNSYLLGSVIKKKYYANLIKAETYDKAKTEYLKNRKVYRYNQDGSFNKEYDKQSIAELENKGSNISKSIKLKSIDSNGYYWGLEKLEFYNKPIRNNVSKRVGKYTLEGKLVCVYESASKAAKENGTSVWKVLSKMNNTHKNHVYKYLNS